MDVQTLAEIFKTGRKNGIIQMGDALFSEIIEFLEPVAPAVEPEPAVEELKSEEPEPADEPVV